MYQMSTCQEQSKFFYELICATIDKYAPSRTIILKNNEKQWVTADFKDCVNRRNQAFAAGDVNVYRKLRNHVNRLGHELRLKFFNQKLNDLKQGSCRRWWADIKSICGFGSNKQSDLSNVVINDQTVSDQFVVDSVNHLLIAVTDNIPALSDHVLVELRDSLEQCPEQYIVSEFEVFKVLINLDVHKASLSLDINNAFLKALAPTLCGPICALINASIRQGEIPEQWKLSRVTLIPKVSQVRNLNTDVRPIAITCPVSKVAEVFIDRFFNDHFHAFLDPNQFGNTKGRSTLLALIRFTHLLFSSSDNSRNIIRVLFVDFRKAFELIDHSVLHTKLKEYNFPPHLTLWLLSFLSSRSQFVKLGNFCSAILTSHAGAPQGTRAGPNAFKILINDLKLSTNTIKYVDDVSAVSVTDDPNNSDLQNALSDLNVWSKLNGLFVNVTKTKEMLIYFRKGFVPNDVPVLRTEDNQIEQVDSFKLLGVVISSDLTWKAHVSHIVSKASKRLYIVYQLLRAGVSSSDVLTVYCALIRSVLEYCAPVWHCGLTQSQTDEIESVQKRVLKLIYPELNYSDALFVSGLERLSLRRENQSIKVFKQIKCETHILNDLLVRKADDHEHMVVRNNYPYVLPRIKTERAFRSFIFFGIKKRW
jgi:hypothetical protein